MLLTSPVLEALPRAGVVMAVPEQFLMPASEEKVAPEKLLMPASEEQFSKEKK